MEKYSVIVSGIVIYSSRISIDGDISSVGSQCCVLFCGCMGCVGDGVLFMLFICDFNICFMIFFGVVVVVLFQIVVLVYCVLCL